MINRMLLRVSEGQSRVCAGEKWVNPRVRGARSHAVKSMQRDTRSPTLGAGKLSVAPRTVNKEPGKKQRSKRNLNP